MDLIRSLVGWPTLLALLAVGGCLTNVGCASGENPEEKSASQERFVQTAKVLSDMSHEHGGSGHATISTDGTLSAGVSSRVDLDGGFTGSAHYQFNSQKDEGAGGYVNFLQALHDMGYIRPGVPEPEPEPE